jgi:hypothetical protein
MKTSICLPMAALILTAVLAVPAAAETSRTTRRNFRKGGHDGNSTWTSVKCE